MCSANFQDFSTELRGEGMQLVQTTNVIEPTSTWTSLCRFQMLAPDTRVTGPGVAEFTGFPHEIGRVSNPRPFSVEFPVLAIIQIHKTPQNERPGNFSAPQQAGLAVLKKPNEVRILFNKIENDFQCFGYSRSASARFLGVLALVLARLYWSRGGEAQITSGMKSRLV